MKRAVIYLRVSTSEQAEKNGQDEGYSIPAQREACRRKAAQMEVEVVQEYADQGESARSADRPQLLELLERVDGGGIDYVIVHKIDRLARNRLDDVTITMRIREAGAQLVSVSESIDETPSGELLHAIMAANAEFFSKNLALETKKGLRQKFRAGGTVGLAPLGYSNVVRRDGVGGQEIRTIDFDPERAPLIRWAFEAYATGDWTLKTLCAALADKGLKTRDRRTSVGKPISTSTLSNILSNPYYVGVVRYEKAEAPGSHEPLISRELFDRVSEVLESHSNAVEKDRKHPHYLKGTLLCGRCGSRLVLTHAKGNGGTYPYFFCIGRQQRNGCVQPYVPVATAEDLVADLYESVSITSKDAEAMADSLLSSLKKRQAELAADAEKAQRKIGRLDDERTKLLQAHLSDAVPVDVLRREQARLTAEIQAARAAIRRYDARSENEAEIVRLAILAAQDCASTYRKASGKVRRLLNQAFFEAVYLTEERVEGAALTEPYAELLAERLVDAGPFEPRGNAIKRNTASSNAGPVLSGPGSSEAYKG